MDAWKEQQSHEDLRHHRTIQGRCNNPPMLPDRRPQRCEVQIDHREKPRIKASRANQRGSRATGITGEEVENDTD